MKNFLVRIAALLVFTAGMIALNAQANQQNAQAASQEAGAAQQQNSMQAQDAKPFSGTIVKEKGKLVLKDSEANVSYQLDDQEKAKPFVGKQVKVMGKLDVETNLIHVENIEAAS